MLKRFWYWFFGAGLPDKDAFLGELFNMYVNRDWGDIDSYDFSDLMDKHGFTIPRAITEAECEEPWAQDWGYEPGDLFHAYTPETMRLRRAVRKR
jgi:hypothetical protein